MHPCELDFETFLSEVSFTFQRSSGPGGQNRNKVETGVVATHRPTGIQARAMEKRNQGENRNCAINRLRLTLSLSDRSPTTQVSISLRSKYVRNGRLGISESNWDMPTLLADILNRLSDAQWELAPVAELLEISNSQLIRFLKRIPQSLQLVNKMRMELGMHPFK